MMITDRSIDLANQLMAEVGTIAAIDSLAIAFEEAAAEQRLAGQPTKNSRFFSLVARRLRSVARFATREIV